MPGPNSSESEPLLPLSSARPPSGSTPSRSRLSTRRYAPLAIQTQLGDKDKGKGKARDLEAGLALSPSPEDDSGPNEEREDGLDGAEQNGKGKGKKKEERGRHATIIFSNESEKTGGNLEIWVEDGESVGSVKDQIKALRPALEPLSLRLIHSGRLLTDGILLLPWLRSLEERVRRQAAGVGGEVENVLKDVGLGEADDGPGADDEGKAREKEERERVWLHCIVGGKEERSAAAEPEEPTAPRRRGFDVLLDAGLSADDVAQMRRQFYESRGEEVPDGMDVGDINDEHARALEEQWIEGEMTAETATTQDEGLYTSILHGLLTGFMFPLTPWFFFRELPLPNFFDAEAEARAVALPSPLAQASSATDAGAGSSASSTADVPEQGRRGSQLGLNVGTSTTIAEAGVGLGAGAGAGVLADAVTSQVYGKRMQMGILLGTLLNVAFGALRLLN